MFFLPYSPRWLTKQGRSEEAKNTLIRLHGGPKKAKMDIVDAEFTEMQLQIDWGESLSSLTDDLRGTGADWVERENMSTNFLDLFKTRPNLHRTICGCLVQAMTQ
jgi:hypothetical protein